MKQWVMDRLMLLISLLQFHDVPPNPFAQEMTCYELLGTIKTLRRESTTNTLWVASRSRTRFRSKCCRHWNRGSRRHSETTFKKSFKSSIELQQVASSFIRIMLVKQCHKPSPKWQFFQSWVVYDIVPWNMGFPVKKSFICLISIDDVTYI